MNSHKHARLTPKGRALLVSRVLEQGWTVAAAAEAAGVSRRTGYKWLARFKVEGTAGAALLTMGVNLDYPVGKPDVMEFALRGSEWQPIPLRGSWFTEAFEGPMSNLQRFVAGEDRVLLTSVDDAIRTMALVEACYDSNSQGGTPIP